MRRCGRRRRRRRRRLRRHVSRHVFGVGLPELTLTLTPTVTPTPTLTLTLALALTRRRARSSITSSASTCESKPRTPASYHPPCQVRGETACQHRVIAYARWERRSRGSGGSRAHSPWRRAARTPLGWVTTSRRGVNRVPKATALLYSILYSRQPYCIVAV